MSLDDIIKKTLHTLRLRGHQWGQWEYKEEGSCVMERGCIYCHETEETTRHNYSSRYFTEGCNMEKICERCEDTLPAGVHHTYSKPEFVDSCNMKRTCERCGDSQYTGSDHKYSEPRFTDGCNMEKICEKCGDIQELGEHHTYSEPIIEGDQQIMECTRCHDIKKEPIETECDHSEYINPNSGHYRVQYCHKCGEIFDAHMNS